MTDLAKLRRATQLIKKLKQSNPIGGFARALERNQFQSLVTSLNHSMGCNVTVRHVSSDFAFAGEKRQTIVELCKCLLVKRQENKLNNHLAPCTPLFGCTGLKATCIRQQQQLGNYCRKCNRI